MAIVHQHNPVYDEIKVRDLVAMGRLPWRTNRRPATCRPPTKRGRRSWPDSAEPTWLTAHF
ncbi:hypothetical protein ACW189_05105 [Limosilactobacillus fermentum]